MPEYDFEDCRNRLRRATEIVLNAEKAVATANEEAADAEALYRAELASAFKGWRAAGKAVAESETLARGDVVAHSRERDVKATALKLAFEKLDNARDSRRSTWRLVDWARGRDLARTAQPENVPGDRWP